MGFELITQPQVFLAPITAVGGIQNGLLGSPLPPLYTSFVTWTSTASITATTFPLIGIETLTNRSGSYIVTVGGVVQSPTNYTVNPNTRLLTFDFIVNPNTEVIATQIGTTVTFVSVQSLTAIDSVFQSINTDRLVVTSLTALSAEFRVVDITQYELSGFNVQGDVSITGALINNGSITTNNISTGSLLATGATLTAANILMSAGSTLIGTTSATSIGTGSLSARTFSLVHDPANDGVDPIFDIGETLTDSFSGFRVRYEEPTNRLIGSSRTGTTILTSFMITTNTGQVGISGLPEPGQALTVSGSVSATGFANVNIDAGTTTRAPITLNSGTLLTTPLSGAIEYDDRVFYGTTPGPTGRGVIPVMLFTSGANASPANVATAQNWFPAANDTLTLLGGTTYLVEAVLNISTTGATSNSLGISILGSGNASLASIAFVAHTTNSTAATTNTTSTTHVTVAGNATVTGAVAAATNRTIHIRGILRTSAGAGGTIVPQFTYSTAPGQIPVLATNNFMVLTPIGSLSVASIGAWT